MAKAVAAAVFLALKKKSEEEIKNYIESNFGYKLFFLFDKLVESYRFNSTCRGSVPQAIFTFLESEDFEDSIRKAIMIGGDSDTIAAINGAIAEAFYGGVPDKIKQQVTGIIDKDLLKVVYEFRSKYVHLH